MYKDLFESLRISFRTRAKKELHHQIENLLNQFSISNYMHGKTFFHPLGFMYASLYTFQDNESIRIHIWDKKLYDIEPEMHIHNHYYTVNSYIFKGCIFNKIYKKLESKEENLALFEGSYSTTGDRILKKTDKGMHLVEDYTHIYCKGSLYDISQDQIHSGGINVNQLTCTIVYTQSPGTPNPLVLGPREAPMIKYYKKGPVLDETIDTILTNLILPDH